MSFLYLSIVRTVNLNLNIKNEAWEQMEVPATAKPMTVCTFRADPPAIPWKRAPRQIDMNVTINILFFLLLLRLLKQSRKPSLLEIQSLTRQ